MRRKLKLWHKHGIAYMLFNIYDSIVNSEHHAWYLKYLSHDLANGGMHLLSIYY